MCAPNSRLCAPTWKHIGKSLERRLRRSRLSHRPLHSLNLNQSSNLSRYKLRNSRRTLRLARNKASKCLRKRERRGTKRATKRTRVWGCSLSKVCSLRRTRPPSHQTRHNTTRVPITIKGSKSAKIKLINKRKKLWRLNLTQKVRRCPKEPTASSSRVRRRSSSSQEGSGAKALRLWARGSQLSRLPRHPSSLATHSASRVSISRRV